MAELTKLMVTLDSSIRSVMKCIDRNAKGIAIVIDHDHRLINTVTDGDIRRAILADMCLDMPVKELLEQRKLKVYPISATVGTSKGELIRLMNEHSIRHIPLLDESKRVVDVALLGDLVKEFELPLTAVIMAGGFGTRLHPLTNDLPKPMLPIGDRPLMEHIVVKLQEVGIRKVNITTYYKSEKIINHFGDGHRLGVEINYVSEDRPLGTAGSLGLMPETKDTLLVMNGDILTHVNFAAMLEYHRENHADMTVAVRGYVFQVPYGTIECDNIRIRRVTEKPKFNFMVNAGIYLMEPIVRKYIESGHRMEMTDLIQRLVDEGQTVISFPIMEYWLDIGQHADYERAQQDVQNGSCMI